MEERLVWYKIKNNIAKKKKRNIDSFCDFLSSVCSSNVS